MKLQIFYFLSIVLLSCFCLNARAQSYGMEQNSDGSYTVYMNGGSVTTNTQGQYSVSNNQGTYCTGCYATPVTGYTGVYYAPNGAAAPYQQIVGPPPSNYANYVLSSTSVSYYDAQGVYLGQVQYGTTIGSSYGVIGYAEGCTSCAQVQAQQQATTQWNSTALSDFHAQTASYQQQEIISLQNQIAANYNVGNTYNYYYYYYAVQQLGGNPGSPSPLPPPPPLLPLPLPAETKETVAPTPVLKLPVDCQGNRTYVSPNGVPFTLPVGAQVGDLNIDKDDFVNGALYSFYVGGIEYAASETFYTRNTGAEPQFRGYYQVVNGICDLTKPYPFSATDFPNANQGPIQVIRLRRQTSSSACTDIQEKVNYTSNGAVPNSLPSGGNAWQMENSDIENATPVSTPCSSKPVGCMSSGISNSGAELDAYVSGSNTLGGASRLRGYLATFMTKNTAKIYLYDCSTNKVKYTITKEGITTVTSSTTQDAEMQKFNSGNFTTADQDIAIKGCLQNGKWTYDIKFNQTKIATPNSKVAPVLNQVIDEIKRQADDEVKKLKSANMRSNVERADINGDIFSKNSMDIFESLCAIYDVGKDIINDGKMPEKIWDGGKRANNVTDGPTASAHSLSPFQMPAIISGCTDQLINEATGTLQLVKTTYQFIRNPVKTAQGAWNGVRSLNFDKIKQIAKDATGITNFTKGGDPAKYQGGKSGVQAILITSTLIKGLVSDGIQVVNNGGQELSKIQVFMPDGSASSSVADALENATVNSKLVDNLNNEKLLTKNITGTEESVVSMEKTSNTSNVYKAKESELIDNRSGTAYTYDDIKESATDVGKPITTTTVNGTQQITTDAGQKGGWNKELNNPKPNSQYIVKNTGTSHTYTIDGSGRVTKAEGTLTLTPRDRNGYQQTVKCNGAKGGVPGTDQGGHLIGSRFDGAGEQINLVPMKGVLNTGAYKDMENTWQTALQQGKTVKVEINPAYVGTSLKPAGFTVNYWINGVKTTQTFTN